MSESDDVVESLTTDCAFDLLRHATRRRALAVLRESDGTMALDELAAATAAREAGTDLPDVTAGRRERTAATLHHSHLPRLDDADVVEYDPVAGTVEATPLVEELTTYVEAIRTEVSLLDP